MADLLGAANRVPGYDSSNNNRALPAAPRQGDTQIQNVVDPTRVGRADGRTEQQGADNNLQSGDLRYDSNLQTFLQRLRETPELPELTKSLILLRSIASSPGLQPGIAQEISQFLEMLQLDADGFQKFFMQQVQGNNRFSGPLFSLLRQAYDSLNGEHVRQSILEFARRYSDFSSTPHISRNLTSLTRQIMDYLPKSWQGKFQEMAARLENGLAAGTRADNIRLLEGELIPYLGAYVERTHDLGPLRDLLNLLILNVTRYENGSEKQLLQAFRQMEGYGELLAGLNQLDDAAILKLLQETDFTRAARDRFADTLSSTAAQALQGKFGPDAQNAFSEIVRAQLVHESVYMSIAHLFLPVDWNGKMMYSELWVDPDAQDQQGSTPDQHKVQFLFKLDLESLGFLEITLSARQEQVDLHIYGPETVSGHGELIAQDMRDILSRHGLSGKDVQVAKLEKPLALTEVFPNLFEGKRGVNVKI